MDSAFQKLIYQAIDQTISSEDFDRLQDLLETSEDARLAYLKAVNACESLHDIAAAPLPTSREPTATLPLNRWPSVFAVRSLMIAATALFVVGGLAFWLGRQGLTSSRTVEVVEPASVAPESQIAGHATLRRAVDLKWTDASMPAKVGDVLPNGRFQFESGVAEIDFFCGATLIVEGPANLDIESDWTVRVNQGRLRATVPPAARGFSVKTAESEVIDLGTEFTMDVSADTARVEVVDGEIMLRGGGLDGQHLHTGERQTLHGSPSSQGIEDMITATDLHRRDESAMTQRFQNWQESMRSLQDDERLIAHFATSELDGRAIRNGATADGTEDGLLVGPIEVVDGRFGTASQAINFDRPGSRVRTRIDGDFQAFTFACWVKIDNLDQRYNALFMGDGYENGEPHWQIRDDGRLMFSVMVDDSQSVSFYNERDQRVVKDAGLHRVYITEPFWEIANSGQWFHLVAVYDPASKRVQQFVNGTRISNEAIEPKYRIDTLRIGPAEIGNWGQPFRETPWFAVRNLDGSIDELTIYNAALTTVEIQSLYESGKPLGY
ncbi:LamG-like jellyroll fold domain-containing protein [Rhodopirellula europaea]|uniref:Protein containing FecR protein domain protein n=1 Tax=Rhodopirellula europaea 6C TaxID=1263867 RepID=M2A5B8_9BACT|nr:LamG-like jellyroll fold domain-containing protein [Rhodopirellula europaea]EMB15321.1 protein containing FecR protein domain protein [Rhodopirellula europaea 6C]